MKNLEVQQNSSLNRSFITQNNGKKTQMKQGWTASEIQRWQDILFSQANPSYESHLM